MELGPIFRALFRSRTRLFLIVTEIALTLAIVVNCLNMISDQRKYLTRPTGLDEQNLIAVTSQPFAKDFEDDVYVRNSAKEDLETLRAMPGVRAAAMIHAFPLSGGGSATTRRPAGSDREAVTAPYFAVGDGIIETLGVKLAEGRDFIPSDFPPDDAEDEDDRGSGAAPKVTHHNVLVTQALAEAIFPGEDALGKTIENHDGSSQDTIVGVMERMHCSWPISSNYNRTMLLPAKSYSGRQARFLVRAEPGMEDSLYTGIENRLLKLNDGRIVTVRTLEELKLDSMQEVSAIVKMLGAISALLVIVTSLGIVGLTAFSVTQRTRQIGTRRALGATRMAILRFFLVESWVVSALGLGLGLVFTYALNFALSNLANLPVVSFPLVVASMGLLWAVGSLATLASAARGMGISPVVATRTV